MQVQQVVGRTLGLGVALGITLGIGALPAWAAPVPPAQPGEVQIGEPLVIEQRTPRRGTERASRRTGCGQRVEARPGMTAAAVVIGALVLGASGRRRWA